MKEEIEAMFAGLGVFDLASLGEDGGFTVSREKDEDYFDRRRKWINNYYATNEAYRERKKLLERHRRLIIKLRKAAA